uniref:Uncharacterized protein n=1 Tax=Anguilla anguilla TaxID=7936 RepID=A0A0E9P7Z2_ANGAN
MGPMGLVPVKALFQCMDRPHTLIVQTVASSLVGL